MEQSAINDLERAFHRLRLTLDTAQGELTIKLEIHGRMDGEKAKVRLTFQHYHYGKFSNQTETTGLEWQETARVFTNALTRDSQLLRLEAPKEEEIPF